MSENVNYLFDIIVTRLETGDIEIQSPQQLCVELKLGGRLCRITSSRINVREFKPDASFEFTSSPDRLSENLSGCGIPFSVLYNSSRIGSGALRFTSGFIDSLHGDNFSKLQQVRARFEDSGRVVGRLEVLCRLYSKCDEPKSIRERNDCRGTDNRINPQDVMFVLGDRQRCPKAHDFCPDLQSSDDDDDLLRLDMDRYQDYGNDPLRPLQSWPSRPTSSPVTCTMKSKVRSEEAVLQSMFRRNDPYQPYVLSGRKGKIPGRWDNPSPLDRTGPSSTTVRQEADCKVPLAESIRFCRVCFSNMSWLPSFAACLTCGAKPEPAVKETEQPKKPTADEILLDLLGKPTTQSADFPRRSSENVAPERLKQDQPMGCRCTCTSGKPCAHCRIRELCADIFQVDERATKCLENEKSLSDNTRDEHSTENEDRPHLERVFCELRDLYNLKSKPPVDTKREPNESAIQTSRTRRKANLEKSQPLRGLPRKETPKAKKQPRIGHKHCVKRHPTVPRKHGWAWQANDVQVKNGWRPGFVHKSIKRIMHYFLDYLPQKTAAKHETVKKNSTEAHQPTLRVWKNRGEIYISLQSPNDRSNAQVKPITFKIVKSDLAAALSDIKTKLKARGFRKCTCHKPLKLCLCRTAQEKKHLERALQKECRRRGMTNCVSELVLTDTSESEMGFDFEVTPPSDTKPNSSVPQPQTASRGTQYNNLDLNVPPRQFIKQGPYWRAYNCAAGDRYTATAFGKPGEAVLEDGHFGNRRSSKAPGKGISLKNRQGFQNKGRNKKGAEQKEAPVEKREVDMMKYIKSHGGYSKETRRVGPDGQTDAQRRRRDLQRAPPIELLSRRVRAHDPCRDQCYSSCAPSCSSPFCCYYC